MMKYVFYIDESHTSLIIVNLRDTTAQIPRSFILTSLDGILLQCLEETGTRSIERQQML